MSRKVQRGNNFCRLMPKEEALFTSSTVAGTESLGPDLVEWEFQN